MRGHRITTLIAASLIGISCLPLLVIALATERLISTSVDESVASSLEVITKAAAIEAERALRPAARVLDSLAFFMAESPSSTELSSFLEATQRARSEVEAILVLDSGGKVLDMAPNIMALPWPDFSNEPDSVKTQGIHFSRPFIFPLDGSMAIAAYRACGDRTGFVLLNLEDIGDFLERLRLSDADHIGIIDEDGRFIAHTEMANVREERRVEERLPEGAITMIRLEGREHFLRRQTILGTPWSVLYYRDAGEARAILPHFYRSLVLVAGLSLLAALGAAWAIITRLSAPFGRIVAEANELAIGHYDRRIEGDWPFEFVSIAQAFNSMAESIDRRDRELQKSGERYRRLFADSEVPALLIAPKGGDIRDANRAALLYYGFEREELLRLRIEELAVPTEPGSAGHGPRLTSHGRIRSRHRTKGGKLRDIELFSTPIELDGENYIYAMIFDITQRVRAEEQVCRDLEEKTVLLKEVHHRVKNNLQIVVSLLHLQSRLIHDPEDLSLFQASQDRIHSMALTHELLYQSPDFSSVEMSDYIEHLASYFRDVYALSEGTLEWELESFSLNLDRALPCGLIINELVTNACRHALPHSVEPRIKLLLGIEAGRRGKKTSVRFEIMDNGPGLPETVDPAKADSLGFSLVHTLVGQLGGSIEWLPAHPERNPSGLLVRLRFPFNS